MRPLKISARINSYPIMQNPIYCYVSCHKVSLKPQAWRCYAVKPSLHLLHNNFLWKFLVVFKLSTSNSKRILAKSCTKSWNESFKDIWKILFNSLRILKDCRTDHAKILTRILVTPNQILKDLSKDLSRIPKRFFWRSLKDPH